LISDLSDCLKAKTFRVQINTPNINTNYSVNYSAQIPSGAQGVILLDYGICNQDHSIELQGVSEKMDVYQYVNNFTIVFNRRESVDSRYPYCYASFMVVY
jgi:hypothetical protein